MIMIIIIIIMIIIQASALRACARCRLKVALPCLALPCLARWQTQMAWRGCATSRPRTSSCRCAATCGGSIHPSIYSYTLYPCIYSCIDKSSFGSTMGQSVCVCVSRLLDSWGASASAHRRRETRAIVHFLFLLDAILSHDTWQEAWDAAVAYVHLCSMEDE